MKTEREVTIELDYPVQLADRELTEVTMRRPTVKELLDFPQNHTNHDFKTESKIYARLTGLTLDDVQLLDMGDFDKIQKQFLFFRSPEESKRT